MITIIIYIFCWKNCFINIRGFAFLLQISLVDLAGSERAAKTGATPEQLKVRLDEW